MRGACLLALGGVLCAPLPATAQQWTPAQQEVVTHLTECWDTWVESVQQGSPDAWLDRCTEDFTYWSENSGAPGRAAVLRRSWDNVMRADSRWIELRPLEIKLYDDIAIMHFYGSWSVIDDGERVTRERKRTEVFRKVGGRWMLIAGHSTPVGD